MPDHDPLVALLDRALDDVGPVPVDGLAQRLDARRARRRRRRRVNRLAPLGAAAVVLAVLATVLVRHDPAAQVSTDDGAEARDGSGAYGFEPGWHELDPGPLGTASPGAVAWTGDDLVLLGLGDPDPVPLPDGLPGAAFDPITRSWRPIAPMPLPAGTFETLWTGGELIVVRTATNTSPRLPDAAAAWDPSSDTWRLLPPPPPVVAAGFAGTSWTGTDALFPSRLARFTPEANAWSPLPDLPADWGGGRFFGGWNGSELVLARTSGEPRTLSWASESAAWAELAPPPDQLTIGSVTIGDRVILARAGSEGAGGVSYRAGEWTLLPAFDPIPQRCGPSVVEVAGTAAVNWCSTVGFLAADRWIGVGVPETGWPSGSVPSGPGAPGYVGILVGGSEVLFGVRDLSVPGGPALDLYVPSPDQVPGSASTVPPPPAGDRTSAEPAWPIARIGSATLDVPNGYTLLAGRSVPDELLLAPPVEPDWPIETPCIVRSLRAGDGADTSFGALRARSSQPEVTHVNTQYGRPAGAFLNAGDLDGNEHVVVSVSADEVIDIACQRLLTSMEVAQYLR